MSIVFPLAFWFGTCAFDGLYLYTGEKIYNEGEWPWIRGKGHRPRQDER
jgi:hypothetical protein